MILVLALAAVAIVAAALYVIHADATTKGQGDD